jgi:hypothetical protein
MYQTRLLPPWAEGFFSELFGIWLLESMETLLQGSFDPGGLEAPLPLTQCWLD